jgi:hypothetical protein
MGAISMDDVAVIDQEECVDCGVCLRSGVCPSDCFIEEAAPWPRSLRATFSNPLTVHKETRIAGRGTEEMKTNEVTGRFKRGWAGLGVEFGRPGIGTRFRDVDKVAQALAKAGVEFEPMNPVTRLMVDQSTGKINDEVLNEKVLSAIIECRFPLEKAPAVLGALKEAAKEIDTVFSVDFINRVEPDDSVPAERILTEIGIPPSINGKNNVGLGRPLAEGGD